MTGLSLVCDLLVPIEDRLTAILSNDRDRNRGEPSQSVLWRDPHLALLMRCYPEYPVSIHESEAYRICVEGRIYQALEAPWYRSLPDIAAEVLSGNRRGVERAGKFVDETDGDFIIAIQDRRSGDVLVLNDFLGRLPLYVSRRDSTLVVTRDVTIVAQMFGRAKFDRLGIAEHLLYGYPLGERTLFEGIERVAPASAIQVRRESKQFVLSRVLVPSIAPDPCFREGALEDHVRDLARAFELACASRAASARRTVVSLSGGLDSRAVAAGLAAGRMPFTAVTRSPDPRAADVRLAAKAASALRLSWQTVQFPHPTGAELLRLLRLKSGMNYLGMAFILPFFDLLASECGRDVAFFTGDGGDKIMPDHRPRTKVQSLDALVRYVLAKHGILPLATVASLTGASSVDIVAALEARLRGYPEERWEDRHVHFMLFERAFKWLFEGEDRNRQFFWSVSPFYGREPFRLAMRCSGDLKAGYGLYRRFMEVLNPDLIDVESTTCGPSLRPERHSVFQVRRAVRRWLPQRLTQAVWRFSEPPVAAPVLECIRAQLASSSPISSYLLPGPVNAVLGQLDRTNAYMLLTLTSTIEYLTTGQSTLEDFRDISFIS